MLKFQNFNTFEKILKYTDLKYIRYILNANATRVFKRLDCGKMESKLLVYLPVFSYFLMFREIMNFVLSCFD